MCSIKRFIYLIPLVILGYYIFKIELFNEITNKILGIDGYSTSRGYRLGSLIGNIIATLKNPIFGSSPEIQDEIRENIIYKFNGRIKAGNTNTFFGYFDDWLSDFVGRD